MWPRSRSRRRAARCTFSTSARSTVTLVARRRIDRSGVAMSAAFSAAVANWWMSGLQIFNAHPALYWGERSDPDRALLRLKAVETPEGETRGITEILGREFDTTGLLGASRRSGPDLEERGFPSWATLPGDQWLAMGRRWHFFFAWIFVLTGLGFGLWALARGHLTDDLWPTGTDLRGIARSLLDHLRFRHPTGMAASRYNVLQKLSYLGVIFGLAPLIVATGLAMSPAMDAIVPWLSSLFGGRQSARTRSEEHTSELQS